MPKLKTNSGAKKRFKLTKSGKIKRANACKRHILESKSPKRKRSLRKSNVVSDSEVRRVKKMLPYGR
ncbi:MAG: 50S ribosomal protein L35 [Spirochaetes bacterium]|jgi:large subunit ribosomal protein L35|nr:50S ribosomal protein L35 [Spirochaetota bacterium]